jgi:hypothetical protein
MISDNDLIVNKYVSIPKEMSQLNAGAFVAGIVEAILDCSGFVSIFLNVERSNQSPSNWILYSTLF